MHLHFLLKILCGPPPTMPRVKSQNADWLKSRADQSTVGDVTVQNKLRQSEMVTQRRTEKILELQKSFPCIHTKHDEITFKLNADMQLKKLRKWRKLFQLSHFILYFNNIQGYATFVTPLQQQCPSRVCYFLYCEYFVVL